MSQSNEDLLVAFQAVTHVPWLLPFCKLFTAKQEYRKASSVMATDCEGTAFYYQVWKSHISLVPTSHWPEFSHMAPN